MRSIREIDIKNKIIDDDNLYNEPIKKYEIFKCLDIEKIMISNTKYLPDSDCEEKDVYYDKEIAIEIYEILKQLNENIANSYPELIELYQEEIIEKQERINSLKQEDERKFQNILNNYNLIKEIELFQKMKSNYELTKNENLYLKKQLNKYEGIITNLTRKLQISLNKYEELKTTKMSFWKTIYSRIVIKRI